MNIKIIMIFESLDQTAQFIWESIFITVKAGYAKNEMHSFSNYLLFTQFLTHSSHMMIDTKPSFGGS